jgi:hypothetical protein
VRWATRLSSAHSAQYQPVEPSPTLCGFLLHLAQRPSATRSFRRAPAVADFLKAAYSLSVRDFFILLEDRFVGVSVVLIHEVHNHFLGFGT